MTWPDVWLRKSFIYGVEEGKERKITSGLFETEKVCWESWEMKLEIKGQAQKRENLETQRNLVCSGRKWGASGNS